MHTFFSNTLLAFLLYLVRYVFYPHFFHLDGGKRGGFRSPFILVIASPNIYFVLMENDFDHGQHCSEGGELLMQGNKIVYRQIDRMFLFFLGVTEDPSPADSMTKKHGVYLAGRYSRIIFALLFTFLFFLSPTLSFVLQWSFVVYIHSESVLKGGKGSLCI